jgi:predicted DNA-binding transcriptional regulator YafY
MSLRRADRLFALLQLLSGGRLRTGRQLADALGVALRTVYRDIDALALGGVPVRGERGVGYVLSETHFLPPLNLTDDEAAALRLGAAMVAAHADPGLAGAARELDVKIDAVLSARRRMPPGPPALSAFATADRGRERLGCLRGAISARRKLAIGYRDEAGNASARTVWPLGLEFWGRAWTCAAWCELRDDFRTFRVDRIEACEISGAGFAPVPGRTLADYLARHAAG